LVARRSRRASDGGGGRRVIGDKCGHGQGESLVVVPCGGQSATSMELRRSRGSAWWWRRAAVGKAAVAVH
jgi:hypothetical protein